MLNVSPDQKLQKECLMATVILLSIAQHLDCWSLLWSLIQTWAAAIPGKKFEFLDFNSKQKMSLSVFSFELMPTSTQNVYIGTRLTKNAKITNKKVQLLETP